MRNWDLLWPVGLLIVVVAMTIIDALKRAVSVSRAAESVSEGGLRDNQTVESGTRVSGKRQLPKNRRI